MKEFGQKESDKEKLMTRAMYRVNKIWNKAEAAFTKCFLIAFGV